MIYSYPRAEALGKMKMIGFSYPRAEALGKNKNSIKILPWVSAI